MYSTLNQGYVFAAVVIGGLGLGILYDIFRGLRHAVKPGKVAEAFMDILFWLMATGVTLLVIFYANKGEPRLFIIIGLIGGAALYVVGPGAYIRKWANKLFSKISKGSREKPDQNEDGKEDNGS